MRILSAVAGVVLVAAPALAQSPDKADPTKKICRSRTETGSFVKRKRECYTKAEWARIDEANRNGATRLVQDSQTRAGGQ